MRWSGVALGTLALVMLAQVAVAAPDKESAPIKFRVVAVNPSETKTQQVPIKYYLPQEVTPKDIVELNGLDVEYDDTKSSYFVQKDNVELAPRETKIFEVQVKDVWTISQRQMDTLRTQAQRILSRLEKTTYYDSAKTIADSIDQRLTEIATSQADESLSRKRHIGAYRYNLQAIDQIKKDLQDMEKLLSFVGGPPIPRMLQESKLKSDAPSTKTTWLLILLIVVFLGMLGAIFFFTWHAKARVAQELTTISHATYAADQKPPASPGRDVPGKAA